MMNEESKTDFVNTEESVEKDNKKKELEEKRFEMECKRLRVMYKLDLDEFDKSEGNIVSLPKTFKIEGYPLWCEGMDESLKTEEKSSRNSISLKADSNEYKNHMQSLIEDDIKAAANSDDEEYKKGMMELAMSTRAHYQEVYDKLIAPELEKTKKEEIKNDIKEDKVEEKDDVKEKNDKEEIKEETKKEKNEEEKIAQHNFIKASKFDRGIVVSCSIKGVEFSTEFLYGDVPELKDYTASQIAESVSKGLSQWDTMKDLRQRQRSEAGEYLFEEQSFPNHNPLLWRDILESSSKGWLDEEEYLEKKYNYTLGLSEKRITDCSSKFNKFLSIEKSYDKHLRRMDEPRNKFHSMVSYALARSVRNERYESVRNELQQLEQYKVKRYNFLKHFPFGGTVANAINTVNDFFDNVRVSMHISSGTTVDISKPISQMNKVERLFCRVNLRQELQTIQMESMPNLRGKLNDAYIPVKGNEASWVQKCRDNRETLKKKIDEELEKSVPKKEKKEEKTKEKIR